jgi:hypothetical protein
MKRNLLPVALLCGTLFGSALAAPRAAGADVRSPWRLQAGLGYHFSSGRYGEESSTEVGYIPFIASAEYRTWGLELTLPYIRVTGPQGIAGIVGSPGGETNEVEEEDGFGDIQMAAQYTLLPVRDWIPYTTFEFRVKAPTASEADGLGTGEWDLVPAVDATWVLGRFAPYLGFAGDFLGDPGETIEADGTVSGFELDNAWRARSGIGYSSGSWWATGMSLEYGSPTANDAGERVDLVPYANASLGRGWAAQTYATVGLASGSPDAGFGLQLSWAWQSGTD